MGQYHTVYNKTKKEYFSFGGAKLWEKAHNQVHSMGLLTLLSNSNGRGGGDLNNPIMKSDMDYSGKKPKKLKTTRYQSWSNKENGYVQHSKAEYLEIQRALNAIAGRWAGDEIVVQGDYAEKKDPAYISKEHSEEYKDVTPLVIKALKLCLAFEDPEDETRQLLQREMRFRGEE